MAVGRPPVRPEVAPAAVRRAPSAGHAYYAEQARQALGMGPEHLAPRIDAVPLPVAEGLVVLLASLLCVVLRPQAVGAGMAVGVDAALVAGTCIAVLLHARRVAGGGPRPGLEVCALPAAALLSLEVGIAGTASPVLGAAAVATAAAVAVLVPHLDARRLDGARGRLVRFGLDACGVAVMVPLALVGAAPTAPPAARAAAVAVGGALVAHDGLRLAGRRPLAALLAAGVVGAGLACAAVAAADTASQATGAAAILLLWYGLRGVGAALQAAPVRCSAAVEYAAFTVGAVALLVISRGS